MKKGTLITAISVGFTVLVLVMAGIGFALAPKGNDAAIKEVLDKERTENAFNVANIIASASIDPLFAEDDFVINEIITNTVKNSEGQIDYVYVLDSKNIVWGDSKTPTNVLKKFSNPKIKNLTSENKKIQDVSDDIFDAGVPILAGKNKIGEVHVGMKRVSYKGGAAGNPFLPMIIMIVIGLVGTGILIFVVNSILKNMGAEFASSLRSAKIEELRKQEEDADKDIAEKNKKVKDAEKRLTDISSKIKEMGAKYDDIERMLRESEQAADEKKKQAEFYEAKINELAQKQKNMKTELDESQSASAVSGELRTLQTQVNNFKLQLQQTMTDIENKRKEEKALTERLTQLKAQSSQIGTQAAPVSSADLEAKKREELELTQRIVAKRKEEIALSQRIELKRKKELEMTGRLELLEKKLKELGNG